MKKLFTTLAALMCLAMAFAADPQGNGEMIVNFTDGTSVTYNVDKVKEIVFTRMGSWSVQVPDEYKGNDVYLIIKDPTGGEDDKKYKMTQDGNTNTYTTTHKTSIGEKYSYGVKQPGSSEMCGTASIFTVPASFEMNDDISDERLDCEKASWSVTIPDGNAGEDVYLVIKKTTGDEEYKMTQVGGSAVYTTEQKAEIGDEYTYYLKGDSFEKCTITTMFQVNANYSMDDDITTEPLNCHAGINMDEMTINVGEGGDNAHQLFMYKNDQVVVATWSSADENIAIVSTLGYVYAIREGTTVITGEYNGERVYCTVHSKYISKDYRLNGSQYFLFFLPTEISKYVSGRVIEDFRPNGSYVDEEGTIMPEDADCVLQIWNPSAEITEWPNDGNNSFETDEKWFGTSATSPTPPECWGNISGGALITNANGKFASFKKLTEKHVLVISIKGNYTAQKPFKFGMKINGTQKLFLTVDRATGINRDGDWETFEIPIASVEAEFGTAQNPFHFATTDLKENKENFTFVFQAKGAGNTVDIDAIFFYIPAAK